MLGADLAGLDPIDGGIELHKAPTRADKRTSKIERTVGTLRTRATVDWNENLRERYAYEIGLDLHQVFAVTIVGKLFQVLLNHP